MAHYLWNEPEMNDNRLANTACNSTQFAFYF